MGDGGRNGWKYRIQSPQYKNNHSLCRFQTMHLHLMRTTMEVTIMMIMKSIWLVFVSFCFSIRAMWNNNSKSPNCRYMQQQSAWPATRTDLVGVLCTRRYFNKLVMRSAYIQNTDTNLKRSPDSLVVAVAVLGRPRSVWGPFAATWPWKITSV